MLVIFTLPATYFILSTENVLGFALNLYSFAQVNEGEMGSPVDVAKLYMKDRPPWTSPCFTSEAQRSASPIGTRLFKDDELFSIGGNSLSSSKVQVCESFTA